MVMRIEMVAWYSELSQGSELLAVGWAGQVFTMFRVNIVTMVTLVTLVTLHRENMVQVITDKS